MCGRYWIGADDPGDRLRILIEEANRRAEDMQLSVSVKNSGEICPGDTAAVVCPSRSGKRICYPMEWGFRLQDGRRIINARTETAAEKPMFRESWRKRRCLIPMSAYFEWEKNRDGRIKYRILPRTDAPCYLAGLYRYEENRPVFAVLTRDAVADISFIHPRMPVIFAENEAGSWLSGMDAQICTDMEFERV